MFFLFFFLVFTKFTMAPYIEKGYIEALEKCLMHKEIWKAFRNPHADEEERGQP